MSNPKKKLTKNAEIIITCIIVLALNLVGYVMSLLINSQPTENLDKEAIILDGLNNIKKALPVLSDGLSSSLIVWCIVGLISSVLKKNDNKKSKSLTVFAIVLFVIYLIWYIPYMVLKDKFTFSIINIGFFGIVLVVALVFFNEYNRKGVK